MLTISVPLSDQDNYDEEKQEFVEPEGFLLELEHSLASLSKWESKFEKPFLSKEEKTSEETLFYIQECMLLTKNPPGEILQRLFKSQKCMEEIQEYITSKQSATTIRKKPQLGAQPIITAEVVYGWMFALNIPLELQHWHLEKLFMQINVCNEQKTPPTKMSRSDAARQQAQLNAQRQAAMGTRG